MDLQHPTNYIIIQHAENVNLFGRFSGNSEETKKLSEKWNEKKKNSLRMARKLEAAGLLGRAERMRDCADIVQTAYCRDCGGFHVKRANLCRDRLCPVCSWRLALQRFGEMRRILTAIGQAYPELSYSLVTVTVKNCEPQALAETLTKMAKAWNRVMQRKCCKESAAGFARSVEITYNAERNEMHPHYHILAAWYKDDSSDFLAAWRESAQKSGLVCNWKAQNAEKIITKSGDDSELLKAVLETYKYNIKGSDLLTMPTYVFKDVAMQFSSKKLISFTGIFKEYAKLCDINVDDVENGTTLQCSDCLSENVEKIVYKWAFGEYRQLKF